jgi:hypothetical protein
MLALYKEVISLLTAETSLSSRIADNLKYLTYFSDCLGALDGTHIDVWVSSHEQPRYRNCKGHLTQNVLAVCDFDIRFTYVLAGWEGLAHDAAVWRDAQYYKGFKTLSEKYWLGDAGYANTDTILVLYCGTRYYLKEQRLLFKKPEKYKELFNLRHALFCNVIERIFGVLKRKYQILCRVAEYFVDT